MWPEHKKIKRRGKSRGAVSPTQADGLVGVDGLAIAVAGVTRLAEGAGLSVVPDFDVVIVRCQGPAVFMGASRLGYAEAGALSKARDAGYGGCQTIYTY
jgi:hypothetical protein